MMNEGGVCDVLVSRHLEDIRAKSSTWLAEQEEWEHSQSYK